MIASQLQPLNIPPHKVALRRGEDGAMNVYDPLRKKWLVLTPEEWVRQHFVNWLIEDLHYPPSLIANEVSLRLNSMQKRSDTVVLPAFSKTFLLPPPDRRTAAACQFNTVG